MNFDVHNSTRLCYVSSACTRAGGRDVILQQGLTAVDCNLDSKASLIVPELQEASRSRSRQAGVGVYPMLHPGAPYDSLELCMHALHLDGHALRPHTLLVQTCLATYDTLLLSWSARQGVTTREPQSRNNATLNAPEQL